MRQEMSTTEPANSGPPTGHGRLGVWDTVAIIIGIVIGSSIFTTAWVIFSAVSTPWEALGLWLAGGVLSLVGALCYAELANTYPKAGGDYVYLTRAFGRPVGFLFGWAQLVVILSGSTGAMAFIFGDYAAVLFDAPEATKTAFAVEMALGAVIAISALNFLGVVLSKSLQDVLVILKLAGLALVIVVGLVWGKSPGDAFAAPANLPVAAGGFGLAMILILYAYGGWNDAAFIASDLKNPRTITKALVMATVGITVVYLLVNLAYILSLGWVEARGFNPTIATKVLGNVGIEGISEYAPKIVSVLIMVSALGAMNGLIFTGSRVYAALGSEHRVFSVLGQWNKSLGAPVYAIGVQALITLFMILQVGTEKGRELTDQALNAVGIPSIPWNDYFGGFSTLFAGTAPVFWIFFLLTGIAFFVLRRKDANIERPFKLSMPWYPLLPLIFCGMCIFGLYSALTYAKWISMIGFVPLALGVPLYLLSATQGQDAAAHPSQES